MFWLSDTAAARLAEAVLAHSLDAPSPPDLAQHVEQGWNRFAVAQYRLTRNETATARRVSTMLRAVSIPADSAWRGEGLVRLALLLDAQVAAMERRADAPILLARLDTSLLNAPAEASAQVYADAVGNLVAAGLWEQRGDLARALAAARRWRFGLPLIYRPCLSTYLREEGRIAALMGDRARAIRAYRHYLALRSDPEPPLRAERDRVRAELALLEGNKRTGG